jgi:endonuclease-3
MKRTTGKGGPAVRGVAAVGKRSTAAKRAGPTAATRPAAKKTSPEGPLAVRKAGAATKRESTAMPPRVRKTVAAGGRVPVKKPTRHLGGAPLQRPSKRMSSAEIDALFERLSDANPAPTTELEFSTPYELLVAVALSAQATDVSVNKATRRLFPIANTPRAIAKLGVAGIAPYLATINFNRTKAKNVVAMAGQLLELHGGEVPRDRKALEALPGVGRKTANVVLNTAFGETTLAVDTHIFRVSNRTGLAPGRDVRAVEDELVRVVPARYLQHAHHWLLLHGRYVCKARVPDCPRCIVRDLCHFPDKTPGAAPPLEVAPARTPRRRA